MSALKLLDTMWFSNFASMNKSAELFEAFNQLNVLIIGDIMIDRYLWGKVRRISPEAPVPVVELLTQEDRLGGAANVALNIQALGATPFLCGVVGTDLAATSFLNLLPKQGLSRAGIVTSKERITTVKARIISGNQHLLRMDEEQTNDLSPFDKQGLLQQVKHILATYPIHVVILQDYNKGVLSAAVIPNIIQLAHQNNIPIAVDPKFKNFWLYRGVDLFKPNLKEVQDSLNKKVLPAQNALQKVSNLIREKLSNHYTLITLSEKGLFLDDGEEAVILPTQPRMIKDVCGAGDTVISVAALGLAIGWDMAEIGRLANLAGGQVCEKVGVVRVDKTALIKEWNAIL